MVTHTGAITPTSDEYGRKIYVNVDHASSVVRFFGSGQRVYRVFIFVLAFVPTRTRLLEFDRAPVQTGSDERGNHARGPFSCFGSQYLSWR